MKLRCEVKHRIGLLVLQRLYSLKEEIDVKDLLIDFHRICIHCP
jgi:hypothetical protein